MTLAFLLSTSGSSPFPRATSLKKAPLVILRPALQEKDVHVIVVGGGFFFAWNSPITKHDDAKNVCFSCRFLLFEGERFAADHVKESSLVDDVFTIVFTI